MSSGDYTILDSLRAYTERHPDKLLYAFLDKDGRRTESYTYEAFLQRTGDIASHIYRSHRLEPGERVLLVYPPGLEMICALFACVRLGLIPVPVYPPSSHGFGAALYKMNFVAEDCGARAALTDRAYFWSLKLHRARTSPSSLFGKRDYTSRLRWIVTNDVRSGGPSDFPEIRSDVLFLQYTSGSTRDPKGVMVTHDNVRTNCHAVVDHLPVTVSWLPQYHDMGLIAFYLFVVVKGGTNYGCSPVDFIRRPLLWLESMSRYRATASAAPNFAYAYCLRRDKIADEDLEHIDLGSMRLLLSGAEPVKPSVFRDFLRRLEPHGLNPSSFSTAYGLAECTLAVTTQGRDIHGDLVSCGRPLDATEVKIVEDGSPAREVPEGHVGEVWVTGPSKCLGYWGRPKLSAEVFEALLPGDSDPERTWLRTGDLGFVQDGELYVCGRSKDVIIVRGANYYPQDIEAIVEEEPGVRTGCVAAFGAPEDGHRVVVVAELKNERHRPDAESINRNVRRRLGIGVDLFVFIPKRTIPKTSSGKISRHRALAEWREDRFRVLHRVQTARAAEAAPAEDVAPGPSGNRSGGAAGLARLFRTHGLTGNEDQTLAESGLDSLATVNFTLDLERYLEAHAASELAEGVDVRWLQRIAISELFELLGDVSTAGAHAKLRFRQAFAALRREHLQVEREMMARDARLAIVVPIRSAVPARSPQSPGGILLTGATGFFGPFLLRSLLEQSDDRIYVLVRARDADDGWGRLAEGLASLEVPLTECQLQAWRRRVTPVCGDLARPGFGLSSAEWSSLSERVHAVYHNGALVNYLLDYASMRATNVEATNEVIRLAATGRPKVLNHVSTTFVFGWSNRETLFETDTNEDMELLDFGYSQSKWVSEQLVLAAMERGLPSRIFRPALIAPSVAGGGDNFDIAIRLLAFMLDHGIGTTAQNQVSLTPADVAANNIVAISNLPDTVGNTFHVTRDVYSSLLDITGLLGELTETDFVQYSVGDFVQTMIERCREGDLLFPLVNFFVHSADNITSMEFKRYDSMNYRAARDRSPFGIPDPPLQDVVMGILRFMVRHEIVNGRKAELVLARR